MNAFAILLGMALMLAASGLMAASTCEPTGLSMGGVFLSIFGGMVLGYGVGKAE